MSSLSMILFSSVFAMALIMENLLVADDRKLSPSRKNYKNKYNVIFAIVLFLIAALRHPHTGADTAGYYAVYNQMLYDNNSLDYYWLQFISSMKNGTYTDTLNWDLMNKLLSYVIRDGQLWLTFWSFVFLFAAYLTIKKYSEDPVISWVYVLSLYIFTFILQGLRQSVAMALILLSLQYIHKRDFARFIVIITLATIFHQSAVIFLIAYPLYKLNVSKVHFWITGIIFAVARLIPTAVTAFLRIFVAEGRFSGYLDGRENMYSATGFIVLGAIYVFCYLNKEATLRKNPENRALYTLSMLSLVMQATAGIVAEMFRVSYYFSMFNMLLVANVCASIEDDKKRIQTRYIIILLFALYFFVSGGFNYRFFW